MKETYLYKKLPAQKVQCLTCAHYCVIADGKQGICGVRKNIDGVLYSLVYGRAVACHIDPIEKKPFFHFLPGSQSLSIATVGCNFRCLNCQNWDISQTIKQSGITSEQIQEMGEDLLPEKIVQMALENNLPGISYTYTEPTIFLEYALDTMKLAKTAGLKNSWVTNGFMSKEALDLVAPYLDAVNVDLKFFDDKFYQEVCGAKLQPVLDTLRRMKEKGIWVEITTLSIPTLSDSEEIFEKIARFIKDELGPETPWHISQFSPEISWKLQHLSSTSVETLQRAYQIGLNAGLKYVYTGNVPDLNSEDTYCPKCKKKVIERCGYSVKRFDKNGRCPACDETMDFVLRD